MNDGRKRRRRARTNKTGEAHWPGRRGRAAEQSSPICGGSRRGVRLNATRMVAIQGFGYLGQALSSAEIFAVLFGGGFLRDGRDRFVLSPGHYVISAVCGRRRSRAARRGAARLLRQGRRAARGDRHRAHARWSIWCAARWARGCRRDRLRLGGSAWPARIATPTRSSATARWRKGRSGRRRCSPPIIAIAWAGSSW